MANLPILQSADTQMQTVWAGVLNPILANPLLNGRIVKDVALVNGDTTFNHLLGRKLQGWFITRISAAATIYDKQSTNATPQLTLVLNSSASATVDVYVF